MDRQKILAVLLETLDSSGSILSYTNSPVHLEIYDKQHSIFSQIKSLLVENADKQEILRLGLILIHLYYMIEEDCKEIESLPTYH